MSRVKLTYPVNFRGIPNYRYGQRDIWQCVELSINEHRRHFRKMPDRLKGTASAIPFMVLRADQLAVNRVDSPLDVDAVILTHRYGDLNDVVPFIVTNSVKKRTRTESHVECDTLLIIELFVEQMERLF